MRSPIRIESALPLFLLLGGCGLGVSQLPEVWDRAADPFATLHMELQIKRAIFCELRTAALLGRKLNEDQRYYQRVNVTSRDDEPLPDSWGAQVTLTLTVDEKTSVSPGVSLKTPIHNAPVNFQGETVGAAGALAALTYGPASIAQSYALGLGGQLSSDNTRYDKYDFYYTAGDLINGAGQGDICTAPPKRILGPDSTSSPFVDASNLGVREWLPDAVAFTIFQRSSRAALNGEGPALGSGGSFAADSATYDNKFIIISDGNITPTWNLVRVATSSSNLLDMSRTRTHELLITIGPGATEQKLNKKTGKVAVVTVAPTQSAMSSHLASQIGSAVAAAIRPQ